MTLVEVVFRRSKAQRANINFLEISRETRVSLDEVEHIIMKALSLGLIKGNIDESTSTVCITWVQPRILGKEQISTIRSRIGEWSSKVDKRVKSLEDQEGFQTIFAQ